MKLRRARLDDAVAMAELSAEFGYAASAKETRERLQFLLTQSEHAVWVADDGHVRGWLHARISRQVESSEYVEIAGLVVAESCRSQGIGAQLVAAAEAWALAQGHKLVRLRSRLERERAHAFYKRLGYREIKRQFAFAKDL